MTTFFRVLCLLSFIIVNGCQNHTTRKHERFTLFDDYITENHLQSIEKISAFKFQGWHALDYQHLIILSNQGRTYLLSLINYCNDLNYTSNIILDQAISSQLSTNFDAVIVLNHSHNKCRIKSIHSISEQQKNELVELRKSTR